MKKVLTIMAVAVFALTFGVAFADEMPGTRLFDTGAYYGRSLTEHEMAAKGSATGGVRYGERGFSIIDTLSPSGVVGDSQKTPLDDIEFNKEAKGAAPGGMRSEEHGFSIIDNLSPTGVVRDSGATPLDK